MRNIKFLLIICSIFLLCSCKNNSTIASDIAPKIIEAHGVLEVDTSSLSDEEKKLFDEFIASQRPSNKVINISENVVFSEQSYSESDTKGIYEKNGNYYIKYSDLEWKEYGNDFIANISLNSQSAGLLKSQVPMLYLETVDIDRYNYRLMDIITLDDVIKYYYKSNADTTGLVINFHIVDNDINEITTIYQEEYHVDEVRDNKSNIVMQLVIGILSLIALVALIVFLLKK